MNSLSVSTLDRGASTQVGFDDGYILYVRTNFDGTGSTEWPLMACPTYAEAQRVRRQLSRRNGEYVIRYLGPVGGGD